MTSEEQHVQELTLGIDVACRAAHQASLADQAGRLAWSGRRFRTTTADLDRLWAAIPSPAAVTVVLEPTRNAWVPLAAWFRRHGARVILVPPEQSADLREYYSKHTKSDHLDSRMLARLPLLHPDGLRPAEGLGPADAMRRATRLRASLVKRRNVILARLDSYLELLGPGWHAAFGGDLATNTALRFMAAGYADPHTARRLGRARLTRFIWRYSHGHWGEELAARLLAAAAETLALWDGELDYTELAADIAAEARLALALSAEIRDLEQKIAALLHQADPAAIMTSVPGVGVINAAQILARLGDPARFRSLAGARSFTGLVPSLTSSGVSGHHGPPTKSGDAPLREALFMAADHARRTDPTLAARYHRLMVTCGKHHNSALCHISTALLTRIIACWRAGTPYQIRDTDGTPLTAAQGRAIAATRYRVRDDIRAQRRTSHHSAKAGRRHQESPGAPTPARPRTTLRPPAKALDTALTDNGMVFTTRFSGGRGGRNGLENELRRLGVRQKNGRPNHPQTQGKIERLWQTLHKWLAAQPAQPAALAELQAQLDAFTAHYNTARPHRSLPHRATPATAYAARPKATPGDRAADTHDRVRADTIGKTGTLTLRHQGRLYHIGVGRTYARTHVLLLVQDLDIRIINAATGELLRQLTLDPSRNYQPTGRPPGPPPGTPRKSGHPEP